MKWSELEPRIRGAILVAGFLIVTLLVWNFFVSPMSQRRSDAQTQLAQIETQLEQMEREVESIPPASANETAAWQSSRDELVSRLGPESELPLLLESLTRLADAQGVEVFVTSGGAGAVSGIGAGGSALSQQVLASVPGASSVSLNLRIFGEYEPIARYLSQVGRLGWVVEIADVTMGRSFPEVASDARLLVYFRADPGQGAAAETAPQNAPVARGARGGGNG